MSNHDTLYAAGYVVDYDFQHLIEHEPKVVPSWSIQNIAFPLGLHSPLTGRLPKPPTAVTTEGNFSQLWDEDSKYPVHAVCEYGVHNPLSLSYVDSELESFVAGGFEISPGASAAEVTPAATVSQSLEDFDKEFELEESSSNEVTSTSGGDMDLPFTYSDGPCETAESICNAQWDDVDELVHELTNRLADSPIPPIMGDAHASETTEIKYFGNDNGLQHMRMQANPEVVSSSLIVKSAGDLNNHGDQEIVYSFDFHGEIMSALSAIEGSLNKVKAIVPRLPDDQHQMTGLVRKQAVAAAVAVKLFSQVADEAASNVSEHQIQHNLVQESGSQAAQHHGESEVRIHKNFDETQNVQSISIGVDSPAIAIAKAVQPIKAEKHAASAGLRAGALPRVPISNAVAAARANKRKLSDAPDCEVGGREDVSLVESRGRINIGAINFATNESWVNGKRVGNEVLEVSTESELQQHVEPLSFDENIFVTASNFGEKLGVLASQDADQLQSAAGSGVASPEDSDDGGDIRGGDLPEGSYILMEIDDLEILTEQTHFCNVCGKGFKRDANLRMHMRSHGGKFKTSAALVRTEKQPSMAQEMVDGKPTRYSCPYLGCNRNMKHPKFQALKTMLCLKNHYRRSHCPKTLRCSICKTKQFSVVADLRTHEKHCGTDRWACSCGTTFSRKEKLFSHISLFVGHVPVDAAMAAHVVSEVDLGAGATGKLNVPPVQLEGVMEQPQRLVNHGESSHLWHGWESNPA